MIWPWFILELTVWLVKYSESVVYASVENAWFADLFTYLTFLLVVKWVMLRVLNITIEMMARGVSLSLGN